MDQLFALWCEASLYLQRDIQILPAEHIYTIMSLFEKTTQLCHFTKKSLNIH